MAKAEIKTVEKKLNVKYSDGVYVALEGGDSEAMLSHLTSGEGYFEEDALDAFKKEASVHGWKLVVR